MLTISHHLYIKSLGQKNVQFTVLLHSFIKRVIIMLYVKQLHITVKTDLV